MPYINKEDRGFLGHTIVETVRHVRVGYVTGLLLIDAIIIGLFMFDVIDFFYKQDRSLYPIYNNFLEVFYYIDISSLYATATLLVAVPMLLTILRTSTGSGKRIRGWMGKKLDLVYYVHILTALFVLFCFGSIELMSKYSGIEFSYESSKYVYTASIIASTKAFLSGIFSKLISFILASGMVIIGWVMRGEPPRWLRDHISRVMLADLHNDLYPSYGRHVMNLNAGAIAPEIEYIYDQKRKVRKSFEEKVPGSQKSKEYLDEVYTSCKKYLLNNIDGVDDTRVSMLPSTARALDVALQKLAPIDYILLSPFEHFAEQHVVDNFCNITQASQINLSDWTEWTTGNYASVSKLLADELKSSVNQPRNIKPVFIISEVCYATGDIVDHSRIVSKIREEIESTSIEPLFIIDGAHSPGYTKPFFNPDKVDAYVCSTHKWLLADEPSGLLFESSNHTDGRKIYDEFDSTLSVSYGSVNAVASLRASIDLRKKVTVDNIQERCDVLTKKFLDELNEAKFTRIGQGSLEGSHNWMLSVLPRHGWVDRPVVECLETDDVFVTSIDTVSADSTVIRCTFPFFLDASQVRNAASELNDNAHSM